MPSLPPPSRATPGRAHRFDGQIAGVGTSSGVRIVIGHWQRSPLGAFADLMVADASGRRTLLAPSAQVADFVSDTYHFDAVEIVPVVVEVAGPTWTVDAGPAQLTVRVGRRAALGLALRCVPRRLATSAAWSHVTDPISRVLLRGVRTRGVARPGRVEVYGATDLHLITAVNGTWRGQDLGSLAPLWPEPRFGFGSTPPTPSVTTLVTTVIDGGANRG